MYLNQDGRCHDVSYGCSGAALVFVHLGGQMLVQTFRDSTAFHPGDDFFDGRR
jgi:hypothetical protein